MNAAPARAGSLISHWTEPRVQAIVQATQELAHKKLEAAVLAAYGWPANLSNEQTLEKLLALNLDRTGQNSQPANQP